MLDYQTVSEKMPLQLKNAPLQLTVFQHFTDNVHFFIKKVCKIFGILNILLYLCPCNAIDNALHWYFDILSIGKSARHISQYGTIF